MIGRIPSEKEVIIYRERARPTAEKIADLLLRSGAYGFWQFQRALYAQSSPSDAINPSRINPEDLKAVFNNCGILLLPDEHKSIVLAYSDSVGFVVVGPFFDAVCPALRLPLEDGQRLARLFPVVAPGSTEPDHHGAGGGGAIFFGSSNSHWASPSQPAPQHPEEQIRLPDVSLESVLHLFMQLFSPIDEGEEAGSSNSSALNHLNAALQVCYEEAAVAFNEENYPKKRVPAMEVLNFIAAELLLNQRLRGLGSTLMMRVEQVPPLEGAPEPVICKTKQGKPIVNTSGFSVLHTGLRWNRLFERYMNEDRRDEWLRGRDERDARSLYLTHTCGYAGHLPEFKRHFGRTFHVIEEDLPVLTKPKPLREAAIKEQETKADRYGPGRELPVNRNVHHYHLA